IWGFQDNLFVVILGWLLGIGGIVVGILTLIDAFGSFKESDEEVRLIQQIVDKRAELERHQQIVEA
ncbi:MAG: hypothetical protein ACK47M_14525, partial [Caldilinea sp.]